MDRLVNRSVKDLLNVPLVDFDDLRLICGEDQATGSYGKSVGDIPPESINIVNETTETQGILVGRESNSGRAKRSRSWEEAFSRIDGLTEQFAKLMEVVVAQINMWVKNFCFLLSGIDGLYTTK